MKEKINSAVSVRVLMVFSNSIVRLIFLNANWWIIVSVISLASCLSVFNYTFNLNGTKPPSAPSTRSRKKKKKRSSSNDAKTKKEFEVKDASGCEQVNLRSSILDEGFEIDFLSAEEEASSSRSLSSLSSEQEPYWNQEASSNEHVSHVYSKKNAKSMLSEESEDKKHISSKISARLSQISSKKALEKQLQDQTIWFTAVTPRIKGSTLSVCASVNSTWSITEAIAMYRVQPTLTPLAKREDRDRQRWQIRCVIPPQYSSFGYRYVFKTSESAGDQIMWESCVSR